MPNGQQCWDPPDIMTTEMNIFDFNNGLANNAPLPNLTAMDVSDVTMTTDDDELLRMLASHLNDIDPYDIAQDASGSMDPAGTRFRQPPPASHNRKAQEMNPSLPLDDAKMVNSAVF